MKKFLISKNPIKNTAIILLFSLSIISGCISGIYASTNNIIDKSETIKVGEVGNLKVHYIDVGQGDSIFIQLPNGETALIDGGPRSASSILSTYLNTQNVKKLDYIIATHPHEDHIGGLIDIINKYQIGKIYMPNKVHTTKTFENLLLAIRNNKSTVTQAVAGESILDTKDLSLSILAPERNANGSHINDYSVVLKLNYKNNSFLFTGDAESQSENTMLNKGYDLKSDVLKLAHHGSRTSTNTKFLNKVNPKYSVISVGRDNHYGHPDAVIMDKLKTKGIEVYRTDLHGTIIAISNGEEIRFNKKGSVINKKAPLN